MAETVSHEEAELERQFFDRFGEPPAIRDAELLRSVLSRFSPETADA